ncbi:MAG: 5-formyltetrahydrofolate cyclo-ligase [Candidatus Nanopelagicales bacterium]|jgi:5-formyltetrahydrofolate cyclo-ligase|nr:5-formyltetrahydrofolate cyclo-ligase [Actinomycetes bacterium]
MTGEDLESKIALRSKLRAARKSRDTTDSSHNDSVISGHIWDLLETIPITHDSVIAAYVPMPFEPPVNDVRSRLREFGCTVLIPIVNGDDLLWAADGDEQTWEHNSFGTLEPDASGAIPSSQALPACTAIIVPAQGIDQQGFRIGQGKGFYDRALSKLAGMENPPLLIGVTYESEFLLHVPTESHDLAVDVSVTESTVRWFNTPD